MTHFLRSLVFGFFLPYQAAKLILSKPKLIIWSVIPILLTSLFYFFALSKIQNLIEPQIIELLSSFGVSTEGWIKSLSFAASQLLLAIGAIFTFSAVCPVIACPFNDFLAEATEEFCTPPLSSVQLSLRDRIKCITIDFGKSVLCLVLSLVLLVLSIIPGLNLVCLLVQSLLTTFIYISYPQTRRHQGTRKGIEFIREQFGLSLGFGSAVTILFGIPGVSLLTLPLAVVGGTLGYSEYRNRS